MSDWEIVIQGSLCTMLLVSSRWAGILVRFLGENLEADPEPGCPTPCADKPQGLQSPSPGDSAQAKDEMPSPRPTLGFSGSEGHRLLALNELINICSKAGSPCMQDIQPRGVLTGACHTYFSQAHL